MCQFKLFAVITVGPHQVFHDLQQYPGGVFGQRALGNVDHFVAQRAQRVNAVIFPAYLE